MGIQLSIGGLIIVLTIVIQVAFLASLSWWYERVKSNLNVGPVSVKKTIAMSIAVLWLVAGITICTWIWALSLLAVGEFQQLEPAIYFSIASFTTLGYGDMLLSEQWRILGALSAVNGLIVFGLNTAFLVELMISSWRKPHH